MAKSFLPESDTSTQELASSTLNTRFVKLDDYLTSLPETRRDEFNKKLNDYATKSNLFEQFSQNIRSEYRLSESIWEEVIVAICQAVTAAEMKAAVSGVFNLCPWQGGPIPAPHPERYGRAVDRRLFVDWIADNPNVTPADASAFLEDILGKPVVECQLAFGPAKFARYSMWATFDPTAYSANPFESMLPRDARGIRVRLGLPWEQPSEPMVLFVYSLPAGCDPNYPTVANAYAGGGWTVYFRPAHIDQPYGYTLPHEASPGVTAEPCPEVIHKPVDAMSLEEPLRLAYP